MIFEIMKSKDFSSFGSYSDDVRNIFIQYIETIIKFLKSKNINSDAYIYKLYNMKFSMDNNLYCGGMYDVKLNTVYIKMKFKDMDDFSVDEIREIIMHEIWHTFCFGNAGEYELYAGFDEFFTQYMTFLLLQDDENEIVREMLSEKIGYFCEEDNLLMQKLVNVFDLETLIKLYLFADYKEITNILGEKLTTGLSYLLHYYNSLIHKVDYITVTDLNELLKLDEYKKEKQHIDEIINYCNSEIKLLNKKNLERTRS